jgi:hypothetical protein
VTSSPVNIISWTSILCSSGPARGGTVVVIVVVNGVVSAGSGIILEAIMAVRTLMRPLRQKLMPMTTMIAPTLNDCVKRGS